MVLGYHAFECRHAEKDSSTQIEDGIGLTTACYIWVFSSISVLMYSTALGFAGLFCVCPYLWFIQYMRIAGYHVSWITSLPFENFNPVEKRCVVLNGDILKYILAPCKWDCVG